MEQIIKKFKDKYKMIPLIGVEWEFYILNETKTLSIEEIHQKIDTKFTLKKEKGPNQFEIVSHFTELIPKLIQELHDEKKLIEEQIYKKFSSEISFKAKPFIDLPGSSFHVNINFTNFKGDNLFKRENSEENDLMLFCIGGLLEDMMQNTKTFLPNPNSIDRISLPTMETPTHFSWGVDNRTTAIRIPLTEPQNIRIEHRLSGSDVDIEKTIIQILNSCLDGIKNRKSPPPKIFGNASDKQYGCKSIVEHITHQVYPHL